MINTIIVINNDYSILQKSNLTTVEDIIISFCISDIGDFEKPDLLSLHRSPLLKNPNIYYSIYIDFNPSKIGSKDFANYLLSKKDFLLQYFFHPKYKIVEEKPLICFDQKLHSTPFINDFIEPLTKYIIDQGYPGVYLALFSDVLHPINDSAVNIYFDKEKSPSEAATIYSELLCKQFYSSNYLGVKSNEFEKTITSLIESEKKLEKDNLPLYTFLNKLNHQKNLLNKINHELKITTSDLENQKTYLDLIKDKDEAMKINAFYYNEYEILPLWYKKIGHIIKVITGKRSFRSLFDNNVKKYKN